MRNWSGTKLLGRPNCRRSALGQFRCSKEIAGKRVRSIYISYSDQYNIVEVDFTDGTSLSVQLVPMVELKVELSDWNVENGRILKEWPRMIVR